MVVETASKSSPNDEDKTIAKLSAELISCQSYWQRRCKMAMLKNSGLSEKKIKLLEFDLNLNFLDVNGVIENVSELYKNYPSEEDVMSRLKKFIELLLEASNKAFVSEIILHIPPQTLLDIFFHVYPTKRSAVGTLSVYFLLANSNSASLNSIGKCFFGSYQAAREEYAKEEPEMYQKTGGVTPYDLLLLHLARSFSEASFGDLDLNQVGFIYITMLNCCVADSEKRLTKNFYGAGIENLTPIYPAQEWNSCVLTLLALFQKREVLIPAFASLKASGISLTIQNLANAVFTENFDLLNYSEILRLLFSYAYAKSLSCLNEDFLVRIPAHMYNVSLDSLTQIWTHFIKPQKSFDSSIDSVKDNIGPDTAECLEITRKLVESCIPNIELFLKFLETCHFEKIFSLIGYSLMVSGQYPLCLKFITMAIQTNITQREYLVLTLQLIQTNLALRDFQNSYEMIVILLEELMKTNTKSKIFVPIIPSDEDYYILIKEKSIINYLCLMLFHIVWCLYVKLDNDVTKDFLLDALLMIAQSIWDFQGYALFPYLAKHITKRRSLFFPDLDQYLNNMAILSEFTLMFNVKFCISSEKKEYISNLKFRDWMLQVKLTKEDPTTLLMKFFKFYKDAFLDLFNIPK
uniref:Uncharacterized protein n=1 Tax=Acrobeloides nanus TaxID=290746 RepID=A0A914BVN4_9BILA